MKLRVWLARKLLESAYRSYDQRLEFTLFLTDRNTGFLSKQEFRQIGNWLAWSEE